MPVREKYVRARRKTGGPLPHTTRTTWRHVRLPALVVVLALVVSACSSGGTEVAFDQRAAVVEGGTEAFDGSPETPVEEGGLIGGSAGDGSETNDSLSSGGRSATAGSDGASFQGTVKIGTVLPLTGGQRDFGEPVLRVTQAFVDEVNFRGGIGGRELQLVAYDACLTCQDAALAAARRLVEDDGVFAVVNPYVMVIAFIPVVPYLDEQRVPLIQGGSEEMTSDALSPVTFATAPPGLFYGEFIPQIVKRYMQVDQIGLTYLNVPTEAEAIPQLEEELAEEGIEVVRKEPIEAAEDAVTSMDSAVTRMRLAGALGVVATNPVLLATGREAAARQGWDVPWYGPAAWSRLLEESCGTTCDDVVFTDTAGLSYTDRDSPQMREFLSVVKHRYPDGATTGHELAAWVGMQLFAEILGRTGPDAEAFIAELETGVANLDLGTTSPLVFTPDRHMGGTQTTLLQIQDGEYVRASDPLFFGYSEP